MNKSRAAEWSKLFVSGSNGSGSANGNGSGKGKRKAAEVEEKEDDPEKRDLIPKVTYSVTKDKALRELLQVS